MRVPVYVVWDGAVLELQDPAGQWQAPTAEVDGDGNGVDTADLRSLLRDRVDLHLIHGSSGPVEVIGAAPDDLLIWPSDEARGVRWGRRTAAA